jgi:hypothetical protein
MTEGFIGNWLVTEYVFNPDGSFAGEVRQQRRLERLDAGQIRITQHCEPGTSLVNHPMSEFAGDWEFIIGVDGRRRHYLGPDVIGTGQAWDSSVITGRGVWTRFAHNFTSFSVMLSPTRQLTGGCFFRGSAAVAIILGVAEPDHGDGVYPTLDYQESPQAMAGTWNGTINTFDSEGNSSGSMKLERHLNSAGYEDHYDAGGDPFVVTWSPMQGRDRVSGTTQGVSTQYGGALRLSSSCQTGSYQVNEDIYFEMIDAYDSETHTLIQLVQGYRDQHLNHFEFVRFSYEEE